MTWQSIFASKSLRQSLPHHRTYWRTVPLRRLTSLLLAIFCLFGMLGCFVDLLDQGQKPLITVVVWSLFSGVIAVVWILAFFRSRRWLFAVIVGWWLGSRLISGLMHHYGHNLTHLTPEHGTRIATIACMTLSFAAYLFFMHFIQNEGSRAVRMQTELALAHGIQQTLVPAIDLRSARTEIYGVSLPSAEVGGDLVDAVRLPDGSVFAYVADVAGHGLPAGILMGMIKTAVHTQLFDLPSPTAVFDRLNRCCRPSRSRTCMPPARLFVFSKMSPGKLAVLSTRSRASPPCCLPQRLRRPPPSFQISSCRWACSLLLRTGGTAHICYPAICCWWRRMEFSKRHGRTVSSSDSTNSDPY